jgi:hypothetical protein
LWEKLDGFELRRKAVFFVAFVKKRWKLFLFLKKEKQKNPSFRKRSKTNGG